MFKERKEHAQTILNKQSATCQSLWVGGTTNPLNHHEQNPMNLQSIKNTYGEQPQNIWTSIITNTCIDPYFKTNKEQPYKSIKEEGDKHKNIGKKIRRKQRRKRRNQISKTTISYNKLVFPRWPTAFISFQRLHLHVRRPQIDRGFTKTPFKSMVVASAVVQNCLLLRFKIHRALKFSGISCTQQVKYLSMQYLCVLSFIKTNIGLGRDSDWQWIPL